VAKSLAVSGWDKTSLITYDYSITNVEQRSDIFAALRFLLAPAHQFFPILRSPAGMWDHDRTANNISYCEYFIDFLGAQPQFPAFAQMVFDAVITAQDHAGYKSKHFFGAPVQYPIFVGIRIQIPKSFKYQVVLPQYDFIHFRPVFIEVLLLFSHVVKVG
jgi:hypothetical protein